MSAYSIGIYGFVKWEGPTPELVKQHTHVFTRPGSDGATVQATGVHGNDFEVTLTAVFDTQANANTIAFAYRSLINAVPQSLVYNDGNFDAVFNRYKVLDVTVESIRRAVRLIGPTYDYPGGFIVMSKWRLLPIATA